MRFKGLITHSTPVMLLGSCFTDNIGRRLDDDMFDITANPTGSLYNPYSVAEAIDRLIDDTPYKENELFFHQGLWRSLGHHSSFARASRDEALRAINTSMADGAAAIRRARVLIVTWGSATAYRYRPNGIIAANCHKLPAEDFEIVSMSTDDIIQRWENTVDRLRHVNPEIVIIYTVSPIRHKAYGLDGNTLNKARLIEAAHHFAGCADAIYFPSYEIMMDDLRDYRFYAADMLHPSEIACDYIYDIFAQSFFNNDTARLACESRKIAVRLRHRVMTDDSSQADRFKRESIDILNNHLLAHPQLKRAIQRRLTNFNDLQSIKNS